ncbi:MAG: tetratricopeptide repeat protein [Deltaproteobacteria bacterium]|nr:MAG: tetratricopeptide repeat protein [Deltaproteobacteria bacterium]
MAKSQIPLTKKWALSLFSPPLLIGIICFLAYSNTFEVPFQFDDNRSIVENQYVHLNELSISKLVTAASESPISWRPTSYLSFALNYYFGGLNVFGYHLVNLLIHALAGIILYFLLVTTLNLGPLEGKFERREWLALSIALLWVMHPVQTQSVTYIVQRMNSMAGMFFLLSLYLYIRGRLGGERKSKVWSYSGSGVAGLLALGSKEIAGILPLMMILYEFYFFQGLDFQVMRRRWPWFIGVLGIFFIIALFYLGPNFIRDILVSYQIFDFTLSERLLTQLRVIIYYLSLLIFPLPFRLNLDYDFPLSYSLFNPVSTLFCLVGLVGLIGFGVYLARRRPLASFGIFWFLGNLAVESSILPLDMVFEHRLYLPLLGFLLFLAGIIRIKVGGRGFIYGAFAIISIFSFWTFQRNTVWSDEFTLWSDCVKKSPNKARPHNNLGIAYRNKEMFDEAIREYQQALNLKPDYAEVFYNLGNAYRIKGMSDEAIREYQQALRLKPDYAEAHMNLGVAYADKGMFLEANSEYQKTLRLKPDSAEAFYNLGNAYADKGMLDDAIRAYQQALRLKPDYTKAFYNLGTVYLNKGMLDEAIKEYQQALSLEPDSPKAFYNLGNAYADKGMLDEAIKEYQQALRLEPDYAEAHMNLGVVYSNKGMLDEAIREYQKALEIKPDYAEAFYNLGVVYYFRKQYNLSKKYIKNAERLGYLIPAEFLEMLEKSGL